MLKHGPRDRLKKSYKGYSAFQQVHVLRETDKKGLALVTEKKKNTKTFFSVNIKKKNIYIWLRNSYKNVEPQELNTL